LDPMQADPVQPPAEEEPFKEPAVEITTVKDAVGPVKEENMTANTAATQAAEAVLPTPTEDPMAVEKDRTVEAMAAEKAVLGEALAEVTAPAPAAAAAAASEANEDETGEGEVFLSSSAKESTPVAETAESNGFPFGTILATLQNYQIKHKTVSIPTSDPIFAGIVSMLVENGIEEEADVLWNRNYVKLKEYKDRVGDCDVPFTDKTLGGWVVRQRHLHAELKQPTAEESVANQEARDQAQQKERLRALHASRLDRLSQLGFDFDTPMWDTRFRELMQYKETHNHVSPPVNYPKLGIWVINQKFNIKDMCKERVAALDSLGFVWNHNRKNRSQARWDGKYEELVEYIKQHGHCNVPATFRHSPLGTWVGKQREEYKKMKDKKSSQLDRYRVDKLNAVRFKWTLQNYTVISWDDRFEALKKFKIQHGHVKIPKNHPDFGNWPIYQKTQYKLFKEGKKSKLTKKKVDRLIRIGFFEANDPSPNDPLGITLPSVSMAHTTGTHVWPYKNG